MSERCREGCDLQSDVISRALTCVAVVAVAVGFAAAAGAKAPNPVLGVRGVSAGVLVQRYDRQTLRPFGPTLHLGSAAWTWSRSPDGGTVALAGGDERGVVAFVDVASLRRVATFRFAPGRPVAARWLAADRLLLVTEGRSGAVVRLVDPQAPRQLRQVDIPGRLVRGVRTREGVALLTGPKHGFGPARLALVDGDLRVRTIALPRTATGWSLPGAAEAGDPGEVPVRMRAPGLAVDRSGERAVVVGADEPVAEIDLEHGAVTYHPVAVRRLARAAKLVVGPDLQATWLRSGKIAVTGTLYGGLDATTGNLKQTAFGLMLLDTRTWKARVVDPAVRGLVTAGDWLVVAAEGAGLTWFDSAGRRRGHVLGTRDVTDTAWTGTFGLVRSWSEGRSWRVDLRQGRVAAAGEAVPPMFLESEPRAFYG